MADDIYSLYGLDEPSAQERAQALSAALQRKQAAGMLAQLTGDKVLSGIGGGLIKGAQNQEEQLTQVPQGRMALALHKMQMEKGQADADAAAQRRAAMGDPNSVTSKLRSTLAARFGIQVPEGTAGNAIDDEELKLAEKAQQAELMRQARRDSLNDRKATKGEGDLTKALDSLKNDLDASKGRAGEFGKNQARVNSALRLESLITDAGGGLRNLDQRQMEELAIGMQNLLSGGGTSVAQTAALVPKTAMGNAMKLKEWLMNEPTGTNQLEFVKRMAETVGREKNVAGQALRKVMAQRLPAHVKLLREHPEEAANVLRAADLNPDEIDLKTGLFKAPVAAHPQDPEALQWAKANPNDPRAARILQLAGGGQ